MQDLISSNHLSLFTKTAQELSLARDLETVMKIVRTAARNLTGADGATFILRHADMCYYADEDAISPLWKGQHFPMSQCVSGWVMEHARPAVIGDIYKDERVPAEAYKPTFVKSLAVVPIRTMAPIGAIGNYWAKEYSPSDAEIQLLQALADITSVTLENVQAYTNLENQVQERTAQLEEKNKDLEALTYSLSHDLRSPLRFVSLYTEELRELPPIRRSVEATTLANKVLKKAGTVRDLIDALLLFFTISEEKLHTTLVSMQSIATEVCDEIREEVKRPIKFSIAPLPYMEGDQSLLKQVWTNLISNAVKYSSRTEKPVIEIGCKTVDNGAIFFVKDNGVGFDKQAKEKLFKVLQRLHSKGDFPGSGLGLAIVDRVIAKHGGRIWAESEPDTGATFSFYLPTRQSQAYYIAPEQNRIFSRER